MSLFATALRAAKSAIDHTKTWLDEVRPMIAVRKMYYSETDRPPSWLRAELQHETDTSKITARWKVPSSISWSGIRLLVRPDSYEHHAVLDIGVGPLYMQLLYTGMLIPKIKPGVAEIFFSDTSLGRVITDDSRVGWQRWSDPDFCREGDRTSVYLADVLFGKETHTTLETKEQILAVTMPDGVKIPMRMQSEYRRRSRARGPRSHYYLRDRSYGPSAEAYHLSRRSGPARTVYDALGEDFADASRHLGVTAWEPQPWHCLSCRGTGMQMDWSRPCEARDCREGVLSPDVLMEAGFARAEKYIAERDISDLIQAEAYIDFAIGAACALGDRMSCVLLHASLVYLQLAGGYIEAARRTAAAGLCELYTMAEATKITVGAQVFAELERHLYLTMRMAQGDAAVAPAEILLAFARSPLGPHWITHLSISQQDLIVGASAAQNLAHDLALEKAQQLWSFVVPIIDGDPFYGVVSAQDEKSARKTILDDNTTSSLPFELLRIEIRKIEDASEVLPKKIADAIRKQRSDGKVNAVLWKSRRTIAFTIPENEGSVEEVLLRNGYVRADSQGAS